MYMHMYMHMYRYTNVCTHLQLMVAVVSDLKPDTLVMIQKKVENAKYTMRLNLIALWLLLIHAYKVAIR